MTVARLLSSSDVAEFAGVTRAAVSNWRRRDLGFPDPIDGTDSQPLFEAQAVVEWLTARDHSIKAPEPDAQLWQAMNTLRDVVDVQQAARVLLRIAADPQREWEDSLAHQSVPQEKYMRVKDAVDRVPPAEIADAIDRVLARTSRAVGRGGAEWGFVDSPLSALLVALAAMQQPAVVYDPACGIGEVLIGVAREIGPGTRVIGADISGEAVETARLRARLHGIELELHHTDALSRDAIPELRADVVVCEPPLGMRVPKSSDLLVDPRMQFGIPSSTGSEFLWMQEGLAHLNPAGRAYVITSTSPLTRSGRDGEVRMELTRRGAVRSVTLLPAKLLPHTNVGLALWELQPPTGPSNEILFIDASESGAVSRDLPAWLNSAPDDQEVANARVPISEVIARQANLSPHEWIASHQIDTAELVDAARKALDRIDQAIEIVTHKRSALKMTPNASKPRVLTLGALAQEGVIEIAAGSGTREEADSDPSHTYVSATDVRERRLATVETPSDDSAATQRNDVLVKVTNDVAALLDSEGGRLALNGVYRVRILKPEVVDPNFLAHILTGSWNERLQAGATIKRAPIKQLEVPLVPIAAQCSFAEFAQRTEELRAEFTTGRAVTSTLLDVARDSIRYGDGTVPEGGMD